MPWIPSPVNPQGWEESRFGEGRGEQVMSSVWDSGTQEGEVFEVGTGPPAWQR